MRRATQVGVLGGVAALALAGVGYGETGNTSDIDELQARLARAEAMIADLKAENGDEWLTEARADEIRGLVYDVMADADTRASLLQGGGTAGYDNGFVITSTDGNFKLKINGHMQVRFTYNSRDDQVTDAQNNATKFNAVQAAIENLGGDYEISDLQDDVRKGFENRRTKLSFSGHVVNPQWKYKIQGNFGRNGGSFDLEDAWIMYDYGSGWSAWAGQAKAPLLREELVSSKYQLATDRTLVNEIFTGDRVQGLGMSYKDDQWRMDVAISDGARSLNTGWNQETVEYSMTARAEFLLEGNWAQFKDFTSWNGDEQGIMIGVAGHFQKDEYGTTDNPGAGLIGNDAELETYILTVDASFEFGGANIFGAFIYGSFDNDLAAGVAGSIDADMTAVVIQGGYMLTDDLEIFGRYEWADLDTSDLEDVSILTAGVNKYWSGHQVKWTTDFSYGFDPIQLGTSAGNSLGYRNDFEDDGQFTLRTQLQLLF